MTATLTPAPSASQTGVTYPVWSPSTAAQDLTSLSLSDAGALVNAVLDAMKTVATKSDAAQKFVDNIPSPVVGSTDMWGTPTYDSAIAPNTLGTLTAIQSVLPGAPALAPTAGVAPSVPLLAAITMPYIGTVPAYTQVDLGFVWDETKFDMSLLTAVQAKLLSDLANGGYGIEPTDEAALWQREREREQLNGEAAIQDAARQAGVRGLMLPPGTFFKMAQAARQSALEKNSSVSRDIAMKRADLYVQNRQFTIEKAIETERAMVEYISAYFGRKLEAAKANLEAYHLSVEIYTAKIEAYKATLGAAEMVVRLQIDQLDANVKVFVASVAQYEAALKAEIGRGQLAVESYKAQISGSALFVDAQYKNNQVKLQGAEARLKQQLESIRTLAESNKVKLGAMEYATKLILEPAQALASMANAYVGSTSSISATFA